MGKSADFKKRIKDFIKDNKWIIIVSIIFLLWKFFLIGISWHNRLSPPGPDDSYVYITHIESVRQCPTLFCEDSIYPMNKFGGYSHLTYRLVFGWLAILMNISSLASYHLSFYIGVILLIPVLILFLKNLGLNKNLVAFSIFFLMLTNGLNGTYIFTWIIPAFFALLLFLLIISIILGDYKKWKYHIALLVPAALYTHTITIYLIPILIFYFIFIYFFEKKFDRLLFKKILFTLLILIIFYFPISLYLAKVAKTSNGNPYGIENFLFTGIKESSKTISGNVKLIARKAKNSEATIFPLEVGSSSHSLEKILPGYKAIEDKYLNLIILNPFSFLILIFSLFINIFYKKYKVVSLFLSTLFFTLLASINEFAYRLLILLWPMTFIFYACSFWHTMRFLKLFTIKKISVILKVCMIIALTIFATINICLSYFYNLYVKDKDNYLLDYNYAYYLKKNISSNDHIEYEDYTSKTLKYANLSGTSTEGLINPAYNGEYSKYYVVIEGKISQDMIYKMSGLNNFINFICFHLKVQRKTRANSPILTDSEYIRNNFILDKEFEDIKIYKRIDNY